jgi:hypothetical protein
MTFKNLGLHLRRSLYARKKGVKPCEPPKMTQSIMMLGLRSRIRLPGSTRYPQKCGRNDGRESQPTPEARLKKRRSELRNGLTDLQRLFLFGKLGGLNDKDAAIAAGYSLSVAENTKQRIWKPQVLAEYERVRQGLSVNAKNPANQA